MSAGRILLAAVAPALIVLAGCANDPRMGETREPVVITQLNELPPPTGADPDTHAIAYRLNPLDKLKIVVAGVPELTDTFQTDTAGDFVLPYAGRMNAVGHTAAELTAMIDARLRGAYIKDPHVAVNLDDASSVVFTVDGQVTQPGSYTMTGNMSLMRAVAAAKGLAEFARVDDVVVFRTVDGKPMAALYNLGAIRRGTYPDPRIFANDLVVVGDSKARRQFSQFIQMLPLLTTPLILALERF